MVRMNEDQAYAFIEYVRGVLERHNTPPIEDAARILGFIEGMSADYVQMRQEATQPIARCIVEGFLEGRQHRTLTRPDDDD